MVSEAPSGEVANTLCERAERICRQAVRAAIDAGRLARQFDAGTMPARQRRRW